MGLFGFGRKATEVLVAGHPSVNSRPVEKTLKEFYAIKEPEDLDAFVKKYPAGKLTEAIRAIDLKSMATSLNPWGTGSIHRTKVLVLSHKLTKLNRRQEAALCLEKLSEMVGWSKSEITPSDFTLLIDLGMDIMSAGHTLYEENKPEEYKAMIQKAVPVFECACNVAAVGSEGYCTALQWKAACLLNLKEKEKAKELFSLVLIYDPKNKMANQIMPNL
jgi:tetratricopeptide (TPR) repeat protein